MWILILLASVCAYVFAKTVIRNDRYEAYVLGLKGSGILESKVKKEHKVLKKAGYDVHYFISGNREHELLIFLPAAFCDHSTFDHQFEYFSHQYRVITIDLMGHGLSQVKKSKDQIDASADHLFQIMESEGYEKAHFSGVSMGSLIAQHFAFLYPEKVSSLAVTGGYNIHKDNSSIASAKRAASIKSFFKIIFSMDSFRRYVASTAVIKPEERAKLYESMKPFKRSSLRVMPGLNKIEKMREGPKRSYPLLLMVGDHDIDVSIKYAQKWHNEDPESKFYIIENAGHNANMDNPEDYNRILKEFLEMKS